MDGTIHKKMAAILAEFPAVTKDRENPSQRYKYRGIDDALRELNPLLSKHGVYIQLVDLMPSIMDAGETRNGAKQVRCLVVGKCRFIATDGSYTECSLIGEGMDMGDKAMMKAQANGLKYALWYTFCVPTDEKKDSEAFEDPGNESLVPALQASVDQAQRAPARTRGRKPKAQAEAPAPAPAPATRLTVVKPEDKPEEPAQLSAEAQKMLDIIAACKTADELREKRLEVRAWCEKQPVGDPGKSVVVDSFVAAQKALG